jgi:retron-type reverse transcriptase
VVSFDNLDKGWLVQFVEHRVADPRILRLIQKWLNAGVMEEGKWSDTKTGSPQGSPSGSVNVASLTMTATPVGALSKQ